VQFRGIAEVKLSHRLENFQRARILVNSLTELFEYRVLNNSTAICLELVAAVLVMQSLQINLKKECHLSLHNRESFTFTKNSYYDSLFLYCMML